MGDYYEHLYLENLNKNIEIEKTKECIIELGKLKSTRAFNKILEIALNQKKDNSIRLISIMALTEIGNYAFIKNFFPLEEQNEDVLELLIIAIGELRAEMFLENLEVFLNHKNFSIKKEIIESLGKIDSLNSLKLMLRFYNDKDQKIKELVKQFLQNSYAFKVYIESIKEDEILNIITLIPKDKAESLILKLIQESKNLKISKVIISAIGDLKLKNGFKLLKELYKTTADKNLKAKIIESVEKLKNEDKKDFLIKIINEEDRELKVKAILSLNELNKNQEIQLLLEKIATDSEEWWMSRKLAIISLTELKEEKFLEILKNETDGRVLRTLIQQLGDLSEKYATPYLEEYSETKDIEIKKVCVVALSKLGSKIILETLINNRELRDSLKPESLKAISNFQDSRVINILLELLKARELELFDICFEGLAEIKSDDIKNVLCDLTLDKNIKREYRAKALMILASYKDNNVENALKKLLQDEEEWWMLKKLAIIISGELNFYSLIKEITAYANGIDNRIKKSAREVSAKFYENYIMETLKIEKSSVYNLAGNFSKLF